MPQKAHPNKVRFFLISASSPEDYSSGYYLVEDKNGRQDYSTPEEARRAAAGIMQRGDFYGDKHESLAICRVVDVVKAS